MGRVLDKWLVVAVFFTWLVAGQPPASTLTVDGKRLVPVDGVLADADVGWLCKRTDYYFEQGDYKRAGELLDAFEGVCPPHYKTDLASRRARFTFSSESHANGYLAFRELYEAEVKAYKDAGLAEPDEAGAERISRISETVIEVVKTPLRTGYEADVAELPGYAAPTLHTGVAESHAWVYDLRWSVNLVFLVKSYDPGRYKEARKALVSVINEKRDYVAYYQDHSLPKSTKDRAADEIIGSVTARGVKMLPGAIGRELHRSYNFEAFKYCLARQLSIRDLASFAIRVTKVEEPKEVKIVTYDDEGYVGYVGYATCKAEARASVRDVLVYFGLDPYAWRPYLGAVSGEPARTVSEEGKAVEEPGAPEGAEPGLEEEGKSPKPPGGGPKPPE